MNTRQIALALISEYYQDKTARRSGVPLMNHIWQGVRIIKSLALKTKQEMIIAAYIIHPLLQNDDDLQANLELVCDSLPSRVVLYAMEYRNCANAYLRHHHVRGDKFPEIPLWPVRIMLAADKVQNHMDFRDKFESDFAPGTWERMREQHELESYFQKWFDELDLSSDKVASLKKIARADNAHNIKNIF